MKTVNMHEAKTQLSKLVDAATKGEAFVIAKSGKPLVRVTMLVVSLHNDWGSYKGKPQFLRTLMRCLPMRLPLNSLVVLNEPSAGYPHSSVGGI